MKWLILAAFILAFGEESQAESIQVSPISVEINAPSLSSTITLKTDAKKPRVAQLRVMRWSQVDGKEVLEATDDVVASPPFATLASNTSYTVRIVRQSAAPVLNEENYRLLIDQLPDEQSSKKNVIGIAIRYSLPIFVRPANGGKAVLEWDAELVDGAVKLTAINSGNRGAKLTDLKISDGRSFVRFGTNGAAGYILPGQSMSWKKPAPKGFAAGPVKISARNETETINAQVEVVP
jgi:fimbrial chaperone protein